MVGRFLRRYWLALAIILVFLAMWAGLWANDYTRIALRSALLFPDVYLDLPLPFNRLGEVVAVETVAFTANGTPLEADIYRPDDGDRHGALLVVVGAAPPALDHPQVQGLLHFLARLGLVVMIPEFPDLIRGVLNPEQVDQAVAAFQFLQSQPQVDPDRIAIIGLSAGGGPAIVAAADPRIRDDVNLVGTFGGYYDLGEVIVAATTDSIEVDGRRQPWPHLDRTESVLRRSLIETVEDDEERQLLAGVFLDGAVASADPDALSPSSRLIYAILANDDPQRARQLLAQLPPHQAQMLRRLSPSTYIDDLKAEVYIVHGRHDLLLPFVESRKLRDALASRGLSFHYAEVSLFGHLVPTAPANPLVLLSDLSQFLFHVYRLALRLL
jgi:acetyl esterase/lipase